MGIRIRFTEMKFAQVFLFAVASAAAVEQVKSVQKREAPESRRLLTETEIFLSTPNLDNFLDAAEEIAAHAAGIWSFVVVACNAMNHLILSDRFNEINEILSLEFFYAIYNYIYPAILYISYVVDGTSAWNNTWNYYFTRVTIIRFLYNTFCIDCDILPDNNY